ncbi:MAG: hypothetical protein NC936_05730 [Candidatus Omnitrophica bacterium]|nr:hypothetical protein [Candidatus Omnitrophota bacterium]
MKSDQKKRLGIIIFAALLVFILWKYFVISREKKIAQLKLIHIQNALVTLEGERNLLKEVLARELQTKEELFKIKLNLERDLVASQQKLAQMEEALNRLEAEKTGLKTEVLLLAAEKAALEEKVSSLPNLKQAIRELKQKLRQDKQKVKKDALKVATGNQGYVIKDGISTYPFKKRVSVIPLP